jgi:hypothetical protein
MWTEAQCCLSVHRHFVLSLGFMEKTSEASLRVDLHAANPYLGLQGHGQQPCLDQRA